MKTELPHIGQYELQQRLARTSTGEVWRAYDSERRCAVITKFYRADATSAADALERYVEGVERVASLHHPNIVPIHDVHVQPSPGNSDALICLAMPYVGGESLADYMRRASAAGKIPSSAEVVELFTSLALALDTAHRHGVVHGNLKPTNILLGRSTALPDGVGTPLLTDFGPTRFPPDRRGQDIPFYLAPEQVKGAAASAHSDIYALGVILYELYTGVPPFRGNRPIAVMMQHTSAVPTPPDLVNPTLSPTLSQVILRCLAKDPQARFPSVSSLVLALVRALHVEVPADLRRSAALVEEVTAPVAHQGAHLPTSSSRPKRKRGKRWLGSAAIVALTLLLATVFGSLLLLTQRGGAPGAPGLAGQAFFLNSGQLDEHSNQGINDELQVDLSNIPDPSPGKSYYAWLLGDVAQPEASPIFLGRLPVERGTVHFLYAGDGQHANLLGLASRFLITEDDAQHSSGNPLLDQGTWRYYGAIPQTPNPADKLHFSMLDHLRHLLVESPELAIRGLHGGLAFWFVRDTAAVSNLANSLADDWQKRDADAIHGQLIRILDYLDGVSFVQSDVPPGTPLLADAHATQVALLGRTPQDADPPGYVYQNEAPPGYVYLIEDHMNGALLAPQTTAEQRQLGIQISRELDSMKNSVVQAAQDARQLVRLTDAQLLQAPALTLLDDLATRAQDAYTGRLDPAAGQPEGGALLIYGSLQRLAAFNIQPYVAPGQ